MFSKPMLARHALQLLQWVCCIRLSPSCCHVAKRLGVTGDDLIALFTILVVEACQAPLTTLSVIGAVI